jgi:REP element-mobilizing transposase RayT
MGDTYTQLYVHLIFAVKGRQNQISKEWNVELYKFISGLVKNKKQKLIAINGMPDHIHILLGIKPDIALSPLVKVIKTSSTNFINEEKFLLGKFYWQEGFGAFSCSPSNLSKVANYIENQEEHHKRRSFKDEYIALLKKHEIEYKEEYLFEF